MTPRLWGQNCKFFTTLLPRNSQKRLEHKEDQTKFGRITRKPRSRLSRVRIVIYREWAIESLFQEISAAKVHSLVNFPRKNFAAKKLIQYVSQMSADTPFSVEDVVTLAYDENINEPEFREAGRPTRLLVLEFCTDQPVSWRRSWHFWNRFSPFYDYHRMCPFLRWCSMFKTVIGSQAMSPGCQLLRPRFHVWRYAFHSHPVESWRHLEPAIKSNNNI